MITQAGSRDTGDDKLVAMVKQGDTGAIGKLIDRHRIYVTRIASRFLLSDDDIREVVQDTFIRVWKNIGDFDNRSRFTTWLYTIVFNLCLDRLKTIRRRRKIFLSGNGGNTLDFQVEFTDPSGDADRKVIAGAIKSIAAELGKVQREIFILRDLQDLPVSEVCRITGFDTVKVKTNLYHARKFMREKLWKGGYL
jgi:RNA polymerase sigma-70 factor (ECF subfamily)